MLSEGEVRTIIYDALKNQFPVEGAAIMVASCCAKSVLDALNVKLAAKAPQGVPSPRAYYHKAIDRVLEMRKLDLERAHDPALAKEQEYYLGRAHRCDDILFWLGHIESNLPAGEAAAPKPAPEQATAGSTLGGNIGEMLEEVNSRSQQKRVAAMKGEPMPTYTPTTEKRMELREKFNAEFETKGTATPDRTVTTPTPGAERLREPNHKLISEWHGVCQRHRVMEYLAQGIRCTCGALYNGDMENHRIEEALAAAPPAPEEEEPMPCDRCQQNAETVRVPTGFSGEGEFLCGKCVSLMLGEAQELMEQAGVELQSRHASAERVREIECKAILDLMGKEPYLAAGRVVEGGEWEWKVVADKVSVTAMLPTKKESAQ